MKMHMLDDAATARAKQALPPESDNTWRQAWCGAAEKTEPVLKLLYFVNQDRINFVTCQECIELLRLTPWARQAVSGG